MSSEKKCYVQVLHSFEPDGTYVTASLMPKPMKTSQGRIKNIANREVPAPDGRPYTIAADDLDKDGDRWVTLQAV